jgi:hypothetical protein
MAVNQLPINVLTFAAEDATWEGARNIACRAVSDWYHSFGPREGLFDMNGQSLFQFSASLVAQPNGLYLYVITVFDMRNNWSAFADTK